MNPTQTDVLNKNNTDKVFETMRTTNKEKIIEIEKDSSFCNEHF